MCVYAHAWACKCARGPEEGTRYSETVITGSGEGPNMDAGNQT